MRRRSKAFILLALVCPAIVVLHCAALYAEEYASGRVIVRFDAGAVTLPDSEGGPQPIPGDILFIPAQLGDSLEASSGSALAPLGATWYSVEPGSGLLELTDIFVLTCPDISDIPALVERLKSFPGIADAEPCYFGCLASEPSDPLYSTMQWYLENSGQMGGLPDVDIDAAAAWDSVPEGGDVPVYVLDSGVGCHSDVQTIERVNFTASMEDGDEAGHGTAVAGIIAAGCDDSSGIAGINCHPHGYGPIISVKMTEDKTFPLADAVEGVNYAAGAGARVVNCSWGTPHDTFLMAAAIKNLYSRGALIVCASGNGGGGPASCLSGSGLWPAQYSNSTFAVGAIVKGGQIWEGSCGGSYVDVSAPGGADIVAPLRNYSANWYGYWGLPPYDQTPGFFGGTSAAAPMASGVAALLLGADSSLTNDDLAHVITRTATAVDPGGWDPLFGWGKVNAHRAVRFISSPSRQLIHQTVSKQDTYVADSSGLYSKVFVNMRWCFEDPRFTDADTDYLVKRYRLQGEVSLGSPYLTSDKNIWVRHKTGSGLYPGWPDNQRLDCVREVGWGAVDTTNWTPTSATLYTYTYGLYGSADTSFVGFYPVHPDSVEIPYTAVLGPFDDAPTVELVQPNGGENWGCGIPGNPRRSVHWVAWDDSGLDSVTIYWSLDSAMTWPFVLTNGQDNDSAWTWAVGVEDTCSAYSRVAVLAHAALLDCNYDISAADFTAGGPIEGQWEPMLPQPRIPVKPECHAEIQATIFFNVPTATRVNLKIFDVRGRLVRTLIDGQEMEGVHRVKWDLRQEHGRRVSPGLYFYRFTAGGFADSGKVVVIR